MSGTGAQFADVVASGPLLLGILAAAAAGFVSFASPCVVPLVPGYMSYLAGVVGGQQYRWRVAGAALMFIAGFTVVFVAPLVRLLCKLSCCNDWGARSPLSWALHSWE